MYKIGDKIVYPMHGAGEIQEIEAREILGEERQYYILKIPQDEMKIMIPVDKCEEIGVREVIEASKVEVVIDILMAESTPMPSNWNHRNRENMEKLKTGDIEEVAAVVRNLARIGKKKNLSTGEKKLLQNAKQILASELIMATGKDRDEVEDMIENAI